MIGQHLTIRLRDSRVIAPTAEARRIIAHTILSQGKELNLFAFRAADTHLHIALACNARDAGEFARRVEIGLKQRLRLEVGFCKAELTAINNQQHMYKTFSYILRQEQHHQCETDFYHDASILPDLLGLRAFGVHIWGTLQRLLPRIRRADLLQYFGPQRLEQHVDTLSPLLEAAAAAACLEKIDGNSAEEILTRSAAVQVAKRYCSNLSTIGHYLGINRQTVRIISRRETNPHLRNAVELQLRIRQPSAGEKSSTKPLPPASNA